MKLTKKIETEIKEFLESYWNTYIKGDFTKWATFITDNYKNIGTTQEEIWNSKDEIIDYTNEVSNQLVGKAELRNKKYRLFLMLPISWFMS